MGRMRVLWNVSLVGALFTLFVISCEETVTNRDGGEDGIESNYVCQGGYDKSVDWDTAEPLAAGTKVTGFICPVRDQDFFKINIPAGSNLLRIELAHSVDTTQLNLSYLVMKIDGVEETVVGSAPLWTVGGMRIFSDYHCIEPGDYYIVVMDEGDNNKDGDNAYTLSYSTEPDTDAGEPANNDPAAAGAPGQGAISCKGDVDYFQVNVGANELLEVILTSPDISRVDLKYTIYDSNQQVVAHDEALDGSKGPVNLNTLHAVPGAGTYYIAVEDYEGNDSDPKMTYTLTANSRAEQDVSDHGARNDHPKNATVLGSGFGTFTKTGQIASKADVDYYRIDGLEGLSSDNMAVIEITVDYGGASLVDPQVALIYPHAGTPCAKDNCCRVLEASCNNPLDCMRETYSCIKKEDIFCGDADCSPTPSASCVTDQACAGAVVCLPQGLCGAEQVVRFDDNGDDAAYVRTAQPLIHPGPWYIRVNDTKNDDYEYGKNYTLTVRVRMDPDVGMELNSEYFPVKVSTAIGTTDYHRKVAKAKGIQLAAGGSVSGFISYEGDQDWYIFPHPCPEEDCTYTFTYSTGPNCPGGANYTGLEFIYQIRRSSGETWWGFPLVPVSGHSDTIGDDECLYVSAQHGSSDYIISVSDYKHNNWSWECGYTITLSTVTPGCNPPCRQVPNQNDPTILYCTN